MPYNRQTAGYLGLKRTVKQEQVNIIEENFQKRVRRLEKRIAKKRENPAKKVPKPDKMIREGTSDYGRIFYRWKSKYPDSELDKKVRKINPDEDWTEWKKKTTYPTRIAIMDGPPRTSHLKAERTIHIRGDRDDDYYDRYLFEAFKQEIGLNIDLVYFCSLVNELQQLRELSGDKEEISYSISEANKILTDTKKGGSPSTGSTIVSLAASLSASWCPHCGSKMEGGPYPKSWYCASCAQIFDEKGVAIN